MPGTLPPEATGFVGRQSEVAQISAALMESRLVTIVGAGGVGKSRVAVRVAAQTAGRYPDGVHLAELSAVRDPLLLAPTVAASLGLPSEDARPQLDAVLDYLRERALLLILDTCEHLVDACAALAGEVLSAAPAITMLATSRQPLRVRAESTFRLRPLPVPDVDDEGSDADAVALFGQRAAAVVDGFAITPQNRAEVIGVCRALDGIPLAIELATVRLRALPLDQMASRLDDRFHVLTGGKRAGLARHQTLRAAIEWSHDLCTPTEQMVWARLSVFAGAFDPAAAAAVCADDQLNGAQVVESLSALAEKSVLVTEPSAEAEPEAEGAEGAEGAARGRYRMLDTLRELGAERLAEFGHVAAVRRRLVAHYLALAQRWGDDPMQDQLKQYRALSREHANLGAAVDYALGLRGNDSAAIGIATSLMLYWRLSGRLREGEYWLNRVLDRCPRPSPARARVLAVRGYVTALLGDLHAARGDAEAAVTMAIAFGDMAVCGRAYVALHRTLAWSGNLAEADELAETAASCLGSVGDAFGLAAIDVQTAALHLHSARPDLAIERCAEGIARVPASEHWATGLLLTGQGVGHLLRGELEDGALAARRGLSLEYELGDVGGTAYALGTLGFLAAAQGRHRRAALLFGGSAPLWERTGPWYTGAPALVALHRISERAAQDGLGEERYWQLRERGAATPLDQITRFALADVDDLAAAPVACGRTDPRLNPAAEPGAFIPLPTKREGRTARRDGVG
jgi:non-specific serine/threonine protein kinase